MTTAATRGRAVTAVLLAVVAALLALQVAGPWRDDGPPAPRPFPGRLASADGVRIGVTTLALARNATIAWRPSDLVEVNAFEQATRRHADIVMWFADWAHGGFDARQAAAVRSRGSIPELSWEPWDASIPATRDQPRYRLARIIDGTHDALIRRVAREVRAYGGPVRIRFAQEMNGAIYPWAERRNGNRRGQYARAWRHVVGLFRAVGADNVTWIWCPVVGNLRAEQYPGDAYVDVVGVSGFNGGTAVFAKQWRPFGATFGPTLDALHALAPDKPVALPEIASAEAGGDKARWITELFAEVRRRPYIHAVTWFDVAKEADWRVTSSPASAAAFADAVRALPR